MSSADPDAARLRSAIAPAWRRGEPSDAVVDRAYQRFVQKQRRPATVLFLRPVGWLALGTLLGVSSLYAATTKPWPFSGSKSAPAPSANIPSPAPRSVTRVGRNPLDLPESPPAPSASSGAASAMPSSALAIPARPHVRGANPVREDWQKAARGLREQDFATADGALRRLAEEGGSRAEREAALLARAQLLLSQRQFAAARELSAALAASAESASIRRKATEMAQQATQSAASERSFEPVPITNSP